MPKIDLARIRCEEILGQAEVGYLGMCRDDQPYCLPFNFIYTGKEIYLHTGLKGTKWIFLDENPKVCFTVAVPGKKRTGESPCQYTYEFESVMVFGQASRVEKPDEKAYALNLIINKYKEGPVTEVPENKMAKLCMLRVQVESIKGRQNL